jgi:hypothetical protein
MLTLKRRAMKTIKFLLCIAGFAITSICSGQLLSQNDSEVLFYTAHYNMENNRLEHQINQFPVNISAGDHFDAPVLSRTYFVPIEFDLGVEDWMTTSFESSYYEMDVQLESWMESPFDCSYYEASPEIEAWMTEPFESGEEIEIETWMTTPWI